MIEEFSDMKIDEDDANLKTEPPKYLNHIGGKEILQLKNNCILKGLVPLFDNNDVSHEPKMTPNEEEVEDCNIGTKEDPKIIKISKKLSPEAKGEYISMLKKFVDHFAWSYEDLKVYDTNII